LGPAAASAYRFRFSQGLLCDSQLTDRSLGRCQARAAARKEKETKKGKKSDKGAADGKASKKKKNGADKTGMLLDLEGENMPAAEGAKKKKGSKKEEKAKKGSKSGKKPKTASAVAGDAGYEAVAGADILGSGEADPAEDVISTRRAVAADETVRISLEVQVDGNQENYAGALLVVENLSAAATVSNVELSVLETANVCFAPAAGARDGAVRLPIKVGPGSEQAALVPFHVEDITQPIALKTAFTYSATGEVRGRGAVFREVGSREFWLIGRWRRLNARGLSLLGRHGDGQQDRLQAVLSTGRVCGRRAVRPVTAEQTARGAVQLYVARRQEDPYARQQDTACHGRHHL